MAHDPLAVNDIGDSSTREAVSSLLIAPASLDISLPGLRDGIGCFSSRNTHTHNIVSSTDNDGVPKLSKKEMYSNLVFISKRLANLASVDTRRYVDAMRIMEDEISRIQADTYNIYSSERDDHHHNSRKRKVALLAGELMKKPRKTTTCGTCNQPGHNKQTCALNKKQQL
uniref:Uncharacterized protein n=1 Tax=Spongospora subterranea TaxID=70186 RepID=A0A0H5RLY7_9EUKA|eukprot:CRZ09744.1 hypothetical protein [Spongospora subterranea]